MVVDLERIVECRTCGRATQPRKCGTHRCGPCESARVKAWTATAKDSGLPRACTDCGEVKLPGDFTLKTAAGRRDTRCKPCRGVRRKSWTGEVAYRERRKASERARYATDPEYREFRKAKERALRYGITPERVVEMLAEQGGRCAICRSDSPGTNGRFWNVDHDHACCAGSRSCGKCVRSLLCSNCNLGLGSFRDDTACLQGAIDYLERHRG